MITSEFLQKWAFKIHCPCGIVCGEEVSKIPNVVELGLGILGLIPVIYKAEEYLLRDFMLEGSEIFEEDDDKYIQLIKLEIQEESYDCIRF